MAINSNLNEPPTRGQPPKRGQKLCFQSVLYSEVPLYRLVYQLFIFHTCEMHTCSHSIVCYSSVALPVTTRLLWWVCLGLRTALDCSLSVKMAASEYGEWRYSKRSYLSWPLNSWLFNVVKIIILTARSRIILPIIPLLILVAYLIVVVAHTMSWHVHGHSSFLYTQFTPRCLL